LNDFFSHALSLQNAPHVASERLRVASSRFSLSANSASVSSTRPANSSGRSLGIPIAPSLVQVPEISGCPHGVFGGVQLPFVCGALLPVLGAWAAAGPTVSTLASTTPGASNCSFIFPSLLLSVRRNRPRF